MALVAAEQDKKKGSSPIIQLLALLAATAVAAGIGWYAGDYLHTIQKTASGSEEKAEEGTKAGTAEADVTTPASPRIVALEPITTNLADPQDIWVRMELALVFKDEPSPVLAQKIHQDLLAYARTLKLRQIETASGFQHLKADLRERAGIRSEGRVSDVLIKTLLYE